MPINRYIRENARLIVARIVAAVICVDRCVDCVYYWRRWHGGLRRRTLADSDAQRDEYYFGIIVWIQTGYNE